jgi:hypothetical protein
LLLTEFSAKIIPAAKPKPASVPAPNALPAEVPAFAALFGSTDLSLGVSCAREIEETSINELTDTETILFLKLIFFP